MENIYNILNNQYLDSTVLFSINLMRNEVKDRKLSKLDISCERTVDEVTRDTIFDYFLTESNVFIDPDFKQQIKKSSPFEDYFSKKIKLYQDQLKIRIENNLNLGLKLNEFYCPSLFNLLFNKLYLLPLWSGIIIAPYINHCKIDTRLTNNPVENWFSQVKNNILLKKKVSTSEFTSTLYFRLLSDYYDNYAPKNSIPNNKIKYPFEGWAGRNERMKKINRSKEFYYEAHDLSQVTSEKRRYDFEEFESDEFSKLFKNEEEKCFNYKNVDPDASTMDYTVSNENFNNDNNISINQASQKSIRSLSNVDKMDIEVETTQIHNKFFGKTDSNEITKLVFAYEIYEQIKNKKFNQIQNLFNLKNDYIVNHIRMIRSISIDNYQYSAQDFYANHKKRLNLYENQYPIKTTPDGNCLYNAISIILIGDESFYLVLKVCSIFLMLKYDKFFRNLFKKLKYSRTFIAFENLIESSIREDEWGREINIVSLAILVNRTIYSYNKALKKKGKQNRIIYKLNNVLGEPIEIGILNKHFFPILKQAKRDDLQLELKQTNDFDFVIIEEGQLEKL